MNDNENHAHLVLGTAQLGMPYGIANRTGQPDFAKALAILRAAWESGIREFDTAQGYGMSEEVLGRALSEMGIASECRVISKLDPGLDHLDRKQLAGALVETLNRFGIPCLYGLMLHEEKFIDLLTQGLGEILLDFAKSGQVRHVGVSVYSPKKALQALRSQIIDMVQVPANVFDRRFLDAGVFELAKKNRKKIYIRSVFLQGLLLMNPEEVPSCMDYAKPLIELFEKVAKEFRMSQQATALGYVKSRFPGDCVVFGAETAGQVRDTAASWEAHLPEPFLSKLDKIFSDVNERIINPTLWPELARNDRNSKIKARDTDTNRIFSRKE